MGWNDLGLTGGFQSVSLGALTLSGANESLRAIEPSGLSVPLLQAKSLTERYGPAETWVPVGIAYVITTGITVTATVVTLRKNGVSAATGGTATMAIAASGVNEVFTPFSLWTFAAADAAGQAWSVLVTTTSTAGAATLRLVYGIRVVGAIATGVTL